MIIYASKPGKLGNMLIVAASLTARGLASGTVVYNPAFHNYNKYFRATAKKTSSSIPYRCAYLFARVIHNLRICNRLLCCRHLEWNERLDLDAGQERLPWLYILQGWQIRCNKYLGAHSRMIRERFNLSDIYAKRLEDFWARIDSRKIVVGIHIRRGDYRQFEGGRYFYTFEQYRELMLNIRYLLGTEHVLFLVSSNEHVSPEEIEVPELGIIRAPGHDVLDMYALARCNYLAGPPSTFTMWASFYGEVPLYMVRDPKSIPTLNEFSIQSEF